MARVHVDLCRRPGGDERLVWAMFDRGIERIGGIWLKFNEVGPHDVFQPEGGLALADEHTEARWLSDAQRDELRAAAAAAIR